MEANQETGRGNELNGMSFARWTAVAVTLLCAIVTVGCNGSKEELLTIDPTRAYIDAKATLFQAAEDQDPATRSNAIEALASAVGADAGAVYQQGLSDKAPVVRFAAAMACGDIGFEPAKPALLKMAADKKAEPDKRVFCAVIYALHQMGNTDHAGELGQLLFDDEREVRMNAAMAMGKMSEPSAIGPLKALLVQERDDGVKIQVIESLARLGDSESAEHIEGYTKGYFLDLRLVAIPALGRSGSRRAAGALKDLVRERHPARVRVAAAGELARLGHSDKNSYQLCRDALADPEAVLREARKKSKKVADTDARSLQCLAALALGWMGRPAAVNALHPMLKNPDGAKRVSAATSTLRLLKAHKPSAPPAPKPAPAATAPVATQPVPVPVKPPAKLHTAGGKD